MGLLTPALAQVLARARAVVGPVDPVAAVGLRGRRARARRLDLERPLKPLIPSRVVRLRLRGPSHRRRLVLGPLVLGRGVALLVPRMGAVGPSRLPLRSPPPRLRLAL